MKAIVLVVLAGCTTEHSIYTVVPDPCETALQSGIEGQACNFADSCSRPDPTEQKCRILVKCVDTLVFQRFCESPCVDDSQCMHGTQICTNSACEPCPDTSSCVACPSGFLPLERNGCPSCECAPPPTCVVGNSSCSISDACYPGADCASGCDDGDVGCCSDQCAAKGCKAPVPAGCLVTCGVSQQTVCPGGVCITDHCDCVSGAWQCTQVCSHGAQSSCIGP